MARPYSMDLRERAVARVQAGESVRFVAQVLNISPSSVVKWSQRFKGLEALLRERGGYRPRVLVGEHAVFLRRRVRQGDFTLRSLVAELAGRGLKADYRTVWGFVHREGLSFKKNRPAERARPAGHRPQAGALESPSAPDRSEAARLHRGDLGEDQCLLGDGACGVKESRVDARLATVQALITIHGQKPDAQV